ncbi:MAG: peptidylprolyl isomerase [Thermoleophilia bacterium]|nr:peptidylprolyl isomerase [Thermoleophilia bacterium]
MVGRVSFSLVRVIAIVLLIATCCLALGCKEDLPKQAIAQVGSSLVLKQDLERLTAAYEAAGLAPKADKDSEQYRRFQLALVKYLITQEILRQEAAGYGITVTESEVQAAFSQIRQMFFNDSTRFQAALKEYGLDEDQLRKALRDQLWLEKVKAYVTKEITVTEEEVRAYYDAHKADYVEQESRKVRHILISPYRMLTDGTRARAASQVEWEAARTEAEKVRREIQNGLDFVTAAERYSDDETTKDSGGDLGAVVRGSLVPEFEQAVFSLKKGEISEPVRTQYGYHLIQVTDIVPQSELPFEQVREGIRSTLLAKKQEETWQTWLSVAEKRVGVKYRSGYEPPNTVAAGVSAVGVKEQAAPEGGRN